MAVSLSGLKRKQTKKSIADQLASQTQDLQEVPWWETVGNIALPLLATAAMGPLGAYLSSLGAAGGLGSGVLSMLGTGLGSTGAVGSGLGGVAKTLGSTGLKALYNIGIDKAKKGAFKGLDKRSEKDIKVKGGPLAQLLGKGAETQLRKDYLDAQSAMDQTNLMGALMGATMSQGSGAFQDMFKGLFKGKPISAEELAKLKSGEMTAWMKNALPPERSVGQTVAGETFSSALPKNMQDLVQGTSLITDASQRGATTLGEVSAGAPYAGQGFRSIAPNLQPSTLEQLFTSSGPTDAIREGILAPRYQGQGLYDASSVGVGQRGSVLSELLRLKGLE